MRTANATEESGLEIDLLDIHERVRLEELEAIVARGLHTFYEVGKALDEIHDKKLYRETHKTFEAYCRDKWDMARPTAYQFINAAQVMENLSAIGRQIPTKERQVRPLTGLSPEQQVKIWQKAVESAPKGIPSGAAVKRLVDEEYGRQSTEPDSEEPSSEEERLRQENKRLKEQLRQQNRDRDRRAAEVAAELERLRAENRQLKAELRQRDIDWERRIASERIKIREELREEIRAEVRSEVKAEYEGQINSLTQQLEDMTAKYQSVTQQLEDMTAKYQSVTQQLEDMTAKYEAVLARLEAIERGK